VDHIDERFNAFTDSALNALREEGFTGTPVVQRSISMRYLGQNYEQDVPVTSGRITEAALDEVFERFHRQHDEFYGYSIPGEIMELVHFNVSAIGEVPKITLPVLNGASHGGPGPTDRRTVYFEDGGPVDCPIYLRGALPAGAVIEGPVVVDDVDSTVVLPAGKRLTVTDVGLLVIE
jgi:N-methylhydantoinase A